jgi:hypothetical protein
VKELVRDDLVDRGAVLRERPARGLRRDVHAPVVVPVRGDDLGGIEASEEVALFEPVHEEAWVGPAAGLGFGRADGEVGLAEARGLELLGGLRRGGADLGLGDGLDVGEARRSVEAKGLGRRLDDRGLGRIVDDAERVGAPRLRGDAPRGRLRLLGRRDGHRAESRVVHGHDVDGRREPAELGDDGVSLELAGDEHDGVILRVVEAQVHVARGARGRRDARRVERDLHDDRARRGRMKSAFAEVEAEGLAPRGDHRLVGGEHELGRARPSRDLRRRRVRASAQLAVGDGHRETRSGERASRHRPRARRRRHVPIVVHRPA